MKAIIIKVLYMLGLVEKSVETIDGIIKRVQKDVNKAQSIAENIVKTEAALATREVAIKEERAAIRLERKKAELLQKNIKDTILKGIEHTGHSYEGD